MRRDTLRAIFIPAAFVVTVALLSHFVFGMDAGRAFNVVFALALATAVVTGALLRKTERRSSRAGLHTTDPC